MKLSNLKIGDKVKVYCTGALVEATVIKIENGGIITEHKPVRWGRDEYKKTAIYPSGYLQTKYGKSATTPKAFYNNKEITI